jgi:hypothetical protein
MADLAKSDGNSPAFVKLPVSVRGRLRELSGAELKVWLVYLTRADESGIAWPGRKSISDCTGLYDDSISAARRRLVEKGWLRREGFHRKADGTLLGSLRFRVMVPDAGEKPVPEKYRHRRKTGAGEIPATDAGKTTAADAGKTPARSRTNEVEPEKKNHKARAEQQPSLGMSLPTWIPADAWDAFKEMRRKIRKPMTERAESLAITKLAELKAEGQDVRSVIEQSVLSCWAGLFPVKRTNGNGHRPGGAYHSGDPTRSYEREPDLVINIDDRPMIPPTKETK